MAQIGQPGTPDSLLANVQLAFAGAAAAPPALTTQGGRLGGQLGSSVLALSGVAGPLVSNLSAASALTLAQAAAPAPAFAAHPSPHRVLGGQDAELGATELAFTGAAAPLPAITSQGGRLGGQLGSTVLALGGVAGPLVSNLRAASVLAIAQTAAPAPTFAAHASPRWVLGGQDSYLGSERLAFAGAAPPQPATGTRTGKLGTPTSLLAGMRMALGQQEGGGGATITYATAASALAATSSAAVAGIVRAPAAASTLVLTSAAGIGCVRGQSATSALALTEAAAAGAVRQVAAAHALGLTDSVTTAAVFVAVAASAASLTAAADMAAVRTLAAADALDLTDGAARTASISVGAESAIAPATAADASAVRAVAAASALDLTQEAVRTSRVLWTVAAESPISLGAALGLCTSLNVGPTSPLDLADTAAETALRRLTAPETLLTDLKASEDGLVRRCAAWALGELGDTSASVLECLLGSLATDSDSSVRQGALWALEELKDARPAVIDGVLRALAFDKAWPVRRSAIWVLRTLGDTSPAVVEGLVRALTTDTDETVRRKAIEMLRDIRAISPLAVPGLLWAVGTEKVTSIRYAVFDVLVNCEGDRSPVIDGLIRILTTSDSFPMREKAAVALRDAESSPAVLDALRHAVITDINVSVRRCAATSLAVHAVSSARAFDVLLETLATTDDRRVWENAPRLLRNVLPSLAAETRASIEAAVARMEGTSKLEGKHCGQCPRCGWSYAWNGSVCGHCNFRLQ